MEGNWSHTLYRVAGGCAAFRPFVDKIGARASRVSRGRGRILASQSFPFSSPQHLLYPSTHTWPALNKLPVNPPVARPLVSSSLPNLPRLVKQL